MVIGDGADGSEHSGGDNNVTMFRTLVCRSCLHPSHTACVTTTLGLLGTDFATVDFERDSVGLDMTLLGRPGEQKRLRNRPIEMKQGNMDQ